MSSWISVARKRKPITFIPNNIQIVDNEITTVYYISNMLSGGSYKYIKDLISSFPHIPFIQISSYEDLIKNSKMFNSKSFLIFQYIFSSNLKFNHIIDIVSRTGIKLIIPIHDFYFLSPCTIDINTTINNCYLNYRTHISVEKRMLLEMAKYVIFPSIFVKNEFLKIINLNNWILSPHIDNQIISQTYIPEIKNNTINIGLINDFSEVKGVEYYKEILNISKYNSYNIHFHIFTGDKFLSYYPNTVYYPRYNNEEILNILHSNNIHSLCFLNKWGETYCYSLTHALRSGLSIIYSNIGAFTERIPKSQHHFPVEANDNTKIVDIESIIEVFYKQLDYIINNQNTGTFNNPINNYIIPEFYKSLFN